MDGFFITRLAVWYVVFLFSTTLHEAMHSYAAAYGGDNTAYQSGQATLNPIPHMERSKFGMIVVPIVSFFLNQGTWMFGWASAPFNPYWAARYPVRSFVMSLAGPLSHLLPLFVSFTGIIIGLRTGFFVISDDFTMSPVTIPEGGSGLAWALALFADVTFQLNLILLFFNLIPLPPLDGSEVWYLFIKKEEDRLRWRMTAANYAMAGVLLAWYLASKVFWLILLFFMFLIQVLAKI